MSVHPKHVDTCLLFLPSASLKSLKMVPTAQNLPGSFTFHCLGPTWPGSPHFSAPESPFPEVKPALSPASSVRSSAVSFVRRFTWGKIVLETLRGRQGTSPQYQ